MPQPLLRQWRHERAIWLRWHPRPLGTDEQREYDERFIGRMQEWLDAGMGACHMRRSDVRAPRLSFACCNSTGNVTILMHLCCSTTPHGCDVIEQGRVRH